VVAGRNLGLESVDGARSPEGQICVFFPKPDTHSGMIEYMMKGQMPICPGGGEYTFGHIGEYPRCSSHDTYDNRQYPKWWK
jgi:hypothetical protein